MAPSSLFGGRLSPETQKALSERTSFGQSAPPFTRNFNAPSAPGQETAVRTAERLIKDYETTETVTSKVRGRSFREGLEIIKLRVRAGYLRRDISTLAQRVDRGTDKITSWDRVRFDIPKEIENAPDAYLSAFEERKKMFEENTNRLDQVRGQVEKRTGQIKDQESSIPRQIRDILAKREDFSVGQRAGRGLGAAGVAALSGSATGVFGAVGGLAGGAVRAISTGLAAATREAAQVAGSLLGGIVGALGGAIVGLITGGPAGVLVGAAKGAGVGSAIGGEVGAGLGEIAGTAIQAAGAAVSEVMTAIATMTGSAIDAAVPIYYQYEKQQTRMSALLRGGMQRTLGQNLRFGYSYGQTMEIMEQYARVAGTTEGSQHAMRYSRMYGVDPQKAIEVAVVARRAGALQGFRGILQRISGATHRAGMGTGRIGEQITALSALSDLSTRARDELGERGLTNLIGMQGIFARQGEAYRGQYGVRFLGNIHGAMTQNQDPYARQLMWRAAGRGGGSLGQRLERYEAGVFDPGAISRLVAQVKGEYGDNQSMQVLAMRQAVPGMRIESIQTLLGTEDLEGDVTKIAEEEAERAMRIGAGSFFTQRIEGLNIETGASSHELLENFQQIAEDAMNVIKEGLAGNEEGAKEALGRLNGSIKNLTDPIGELTAGLISRLGTVNMSDVSKIIPEQVAGAAGKNLLAARGRPLKDVFAGLPPDIQAQAMRDFIATYEKVFGNLSAEQEKAMMAGNFEMLVVTNGSASRGE